MTRHGRDGPPAVVGQASVLPADPLSPSWRVKAWGHRCGLESPAEHAIDTRHRLAATATVEHL